MPKVWIAVVMTVFAVGVQVNATLSGPPDSISITIEKPVHFSAADGSDRVVTAETYSSQEEGS